MDRGRYEAIHRALLTGLLSNVGRKRDAHEYTGARGRKFHLFPGSGLFSRKPPWVMAAEMTETTRLYARTAARIDPGWVERAADHLVKRQYADPHWERESGHVVALESVTLYGLSLVARRRVHYGPIDPKVSREIFIRFALVEGEHRTDAPYFRHNRQLLREVELMEAKLRRRDILADAETRFAFYDARIPAGIYNGPLFETWRREVEKQDKRRLFMGKEDLMLPVPDPPRDLFPDFVQIDDPKAGRGLRFALEYHFEPGDPLDGVTAVIPLALLNAAPADPFEWLVAGHLHEKAAGLIKTLPKALRVPLTPVPDTVRRVLPLMKFGDGALLGSLSWQIGRATGVQIPPGSWDAAALPDWLRMNFRVVDEASQTLEVGRDLDEIRRKLRVELKQTFDRLPHGQWRRDNLTRWDFGDLPEEVEVRQPGMTVKGFPALIDAGEAVHLRLMETRSAAAAAMRGGVRRLFMLQLGGEMKRLASRLPNIDRMCLHYAPVGPCDALRRDLVDRIVDRAMYDDAPPPAPVRTQEAFALLAEAGWKRLSAATAEVCALGDDILTAYHALTIQLSGNHPPVIHPSIVDMREQLAHLVYRGFIVRTPYEWLRHYPRFLKGIDVRLRKLLNAGAVRDGSAMSEFRPLWEGFVRRAQAHQMRNIIDPALWRVRWMLEELRISLFAQELKTSAPISAKRVAALWADVQA